MKVQRRVYVELTRAELEAAVTAYAKLPDGAKIDGFWVESACMAAPKAVCGFNYTEAESAHDGR